MCYFSNSMRYPVITVNCITHALNNPIFGRVDFIVGTGISGTIVLLPVSIQSGIPCGAVRKRIDVDSCNSEGGSHSSIKIETCVPLDTESLAMS